MNFEFLKIKKWALVTTIILYLVYLLSFILLPFCGCIANSCDGGMMHGVVACGNCECYTIIDVIIQIGLFWIFPLIFIYTLISVVIRK